jgi:hypothetical protein
MREEAKIAGYTFPYLRDEAQEVAKLYKAACTPDIFLFDSNRRLVYRGQLDGSRPRNDIPVTGSDLRAPPMRYLPDDCRGGSEAQRRVQYQVEARQ